MPDCRSFPSARPRLSAAFMIGVWAFVTGCDSSSKDEATAPDTSSDERSIRPNVLLVTLDTVRADRLGCYGANPTPSPHLDRLAAEGVRIERAFAPVPLTLPAHSTVLTGLTPVGHGVRDNGLYRLPDSAETLAELLQDEGYRTGAFVAAFVLDGQFGLAQGFDHYDDQLSETEHTEDGTVQERPCEEVAARAQAWIEDGPSDTPWFAWVHFYDPHFPYIATVPYGAQFPGDAYAAEIARTDAQLGQLRAFLEERNELDHTWIVVTADHGEALGQHGEPTHGYFVHQATMAVPMVWRHPSLDAGRVVPSADLADVAPTVLDQLACDVPDWMQGRALSFGDDQPPDDDAFHYMESQLPRIAFGFQPLVAASDGRWKLIAHAPSEEGPATPRLYDLHADPGEERDVAREHPEVVQRLIDGLAEARSAPSLDSSFDASESLGPALESLGYMKGQRDTPVTRTSWTREELLAVLRLRDEARSLFIAQRLDDSLARSMELVGAAPMCAQGWELAGTCLARMRRYDEALEHLDQALELQPDLPDAHWNRATCLHFLDRSDEAWTAVERTVELNPKHTQGLRMLAQGALDREEWTRARTLLTQLRDASPKSPEGQFATQQLERLRRDGR